MAKDFVTVTKDGVSRTVCKAVVMDYVSKGWIADDGTKPLDAATLAKENAKLKAENEKLKGDFEKVKGDFEKLKAENEKLKGGK